MFLFRAVVLAGAVAAPAPLQAQVRDIAPRWSPDGRRIMVVANVENPAPIGAAQAGTTRLAALGWLGGCWELRRGQRVTIEMWIPPAGELMLGASRTTVSGVLREWEQLRLSLRGDTVIYTSLPSGQKETEFKTLVVSDSGFTVENPAHDFPQRIIYRKRGADSLVARIEGPGQGGTRGIDFPMKRVACTAP